ncbi:MAG TPA: hypothetical protein VHE37_05220 [Nevskiaceae bacterium]|nr:hypothetical protein [Nevskiaceae bacterium]
MNPAFSSRCFFAVEAENDPTVATRLLHLLTVRGQTPEWFSLRKHRPEALRISVEVAGVDDAAARQLAQQMQRIPAVIGVSRSWLARRDALTP